MRAGLGAGGVPGPWLPDTRFGGWLVSREVWSAYVVAVALTDLVRLLGRERGDARYPAILDVGCGAGMAFALLEDAFRPEVLVGLDPDPGMLGRAARRAARCRSRVDLRCATATRVPLSDQSVDMIFCHQTLHHVLQPETAAREFHRVLRPGGVLLLSESCAPFIRSLRVRLLFRHPMHAQRRSDEYLALLGDAGFAFTEANVATPYPWWSRWDLGVLERLGRPPRGRRPQMVLHLAAVRRG